MENSATKSEIPQKKNISLSAKLVSFVTAIIIVSSVTIGFISISVFYRKMLADTRTQLANSADAVTRILADWGIKLHGNASLIAANPEVAAATEDKDSAQLRWLLSELSAPLDTDDILVLDGLGQVLCSQKGLVPPGTGPSQLSAVKSAAQQQDSVSFEQVAAVPFAQVSAVPVTQAGQTRGFVVTLYDLSGQSLLRLIQNGFNAECTVFRGQERIASSISGVTGTRLENAEIVSAVLKKGGTFLGTNVIGGKDYLSVYQPLRASDGSITGMLFCAKSMEVIKSVVNNTLGTAVPVIVVLAAVMIVLALVFILSIMRRIADVGKFL